MRVIVRCMTKPPRTARPLHRTPKGVKMLIDSAEDGTSEELTEDSAVSRFESLLSQEDEDDRETPPTQKSPESEQKPDDAAVETSTEPVEAKEGESKEAEKTEDEPTEIPASTTLDPNLKVKVKIAGEDREVTLEEALKGYSRTEDYTRKTQELAERRKALEPEFVGVRDERQKYASLLGQLEQTLSEQAAAVGRPDWAKVQLEQPDEFPALYASWAAHDERMTAVRKEREQAEAVVQRDRAQAEQQYLDQQKAKLLEFIPEWSDAKVAKTEKEKLVAFALSAGYSDEEVGLVKDARIIRVLRKAMLYDQAQQDKPKIQARIEKVLTATPGPASGVGGKPVSEVTRRLQRLAKTGKQADAAAAFEAMLGD